MRKILNNNNNTRLPSTLNNQMEMKIGKNYQTHANYQQKRKRRSGSFYEKKSCKRSKSHIATPKEGLHTFNIQGSHNGTNKTLFPFSWYLKLLARTINLGWLWCLANDKYTIQHAIMIKGIIFFAECIQIILIKMTLYSGLRIWFIVRGPTTSFQPDHLL